MNILWKKFAQKLGLTYTPGHFPHKQEQVKGVYRGYDCQLSPWGSGIEIILRTTAQSIPPGLITSDLATSLLLKPDLAAQLNGYLRLEDKGNKLFYHQFTSIDRRHHNLAYLRGLLEDLCQVADDYRKFLAGGGETIFALQENHPKLSRLIRRLLLDITEDTAERFAPNLKYLICPICLTRYAKHTIHISGFPVTYYACRRCHQSKLVIHTQKIVLVLDNRLKEEQILRGETLYINWFKRDAYVDFDIINIIQASDEDVERLTIQIGNMIDRREQAKYKNISCVISTRCQLVASTIRMLAQIFENVETKEMIDILH